MNRMLFPATALTNRYDEYAKTLFVRRIHLKEKSRALATLRDTLLPKLISGELRTNCRNFNKEMIEPQPIKTEL